MKSPEKLEQEFEFFFTSIGFERVSHYLGKSPSFKNADFIKVQDQIIVELKILDKDFFREGGIIDRFHSFLPIPKNVDENGFGLYEFKFPPVNRKGRHDTFEEPLRKNLKNANKQIKETKNAFFSGKGYGFVVFVLNQFQSLDPQIIVEMLCELMNEEFSSTNGFILCSPSWKPATFERNPICVSVSRTSSSEEARKHIYDIGKAWGVFVDAGGHG